VCRGYQQAELGGKLYHVLQEGYYGGSQPRKCFGVDLSHGTFLVRAPYGSLSIRVIAGTAGEARRSLLARRFPVVW
jgi:hypothetical protein